ncbi:MULTISPECIES: transposase [Chryseobacterium]|jgi:transposase|uniref:Transposase n=2 Tax=Chryseobacterium TaxID=59732 RepID=A0AAJ1R9P2_9FLAO|nr:MULTISPECIES: transposase [Chryseobacterium]MCF2221381.1 transposase [Chryseobacterium sp. PS-8]MDN4014832.1 transposase [Chryseobacterium gambrini]MDN4028563.1 transposase [Chryseobacterium gambrini]QWA37860.1 transposase [Chryseobacterium sp. ZHDP1]
MLYKDIHIGQFIKERANELEVSKERMCSFLKKDEKAVDKIFESASIETDLLLRCSKLLEYDFFRIYSSHLILYAPPSAVDKTKTKSDKIPYFRKNIYTQEIKEFIIGKILSGEMTHNEIIQEYSIPKSTLHRWLQKT